MPVKKIEGLPSASEIAEEVKKEDTQLEDQTQKKSARKKLKPVLIVLAVIAVILLAVAFTKDHIFPTINGTAVITGNVTDETGAPIPADVYLVSTKLSTTADSAGNFTLSNVPSGKNELLISYKGQGVDLYVDVSTGQSYSVGSVQIRSTQIPTQ